MKNFFLRYIASVNYKTYWRWSIMCLRLYLKSSLKRVKANKYLLKTDLLHGIMTTVLSIIDINFCQQQKVRNTNAYFLLKCYFLMRGQAILTFQKPPSTDLVNLRVTFSELLFWSSELLEASGFLYPSGGELLELRLLDKKWNRSFFICRTCINI